ncbi:MAG TPA: hypothetical protein VM658_04345 [bacterium]|nr:hypothetical protein [bacterium]
MKKTLACLVLVAMIAPLAAWAQEIDFKPLSLAAENDRIAKLGFAPTGPGNAADLYIPYLKGEAKITQEPWFSHLSLLMLNDPKPGDAEKIQKALAASADDLKIIMEASSRRDCTIWGPYWKVDQTKAYFEQDTPKYINLRQLGVLFIAKGYELAKAGDAKGAAEQYTTVLRMGIHLSQDPTAIGNAVGLDMRMAGANRMAKLMKDTNDPSAADWDDYMKSCEDIKAAWKAFYCPTGFVSSWGEEKVESFVRDKDMPFTARFDCLAWNHYCLQSKVAYLKCYAMGVPGWVKKLEAEISQESDTAKQLVDQLNAHPGSIKWIGEVEENY